MQKNHYYSSTEVGTMLEELKSNFKTVSEVVIPLREDMTEVKERLSALETRVVTLSDAIRVGFPAFNARLASLEAKVS